MAPAQSRLESIAKKLKSTDRSIRLAAAIYLEDVAMLETPCSLENIIGEVRQAVFKEEEDANVVEHLLTILDSRGDDGDFLPKVLSLEKFQKNGKLYTPKISQIKAAIDLRTRIDEQEVHE